MAQDDWIMWIVGGVLALIGYTFITSQKAGAGANTDAQPMESNVAKSGGCGCHA